MTETRGTWVWFQVGSFLHIAECVSTQNAERRLISYAMTKDQTWVAALIFVGFSALLGGVWYGSYSEAEKWKKLIYRAELPASCERRIDEAAKQLNFEAEEKARLEPDRY